MLLLDVPVVFICPDHNEKYNERKQYMFDFLQKLGFKNVTMFKSRSDMHYSKCIAEATCEILSQNMDNPVLLLEDDIELTEWAHSDMEIDIPGDTDAFYLGFGRFGASRTSFTDSNGCDSSEVIYISDKYIRVINMLDAHAILYISRRYKQAIIDQMKKMFASHILMINDVLIAHIQQDYNIYAYKYPFFFQTNNLGNPEYKNYCTNFRF